MLQSKFMGVFTDFCCGFVFKFDQSDNCSLTFFFSVGFFNLYESFFLCSSLQCSFNVRICLFVGTSKVIISPYILPHYFLLYLSSLLFIYSSKIITIGPLIENEIFTQIHKRITESNLSSPYLVLN